MNKINQPAKFDFPNHYKGDSLIPFVIKLKYKATGLPIDLTDANIAMQLKRNYSTRTIYEFNSDGSGDALITIIDAENGMILFPFIEAWNIPTSRYVYDLQIIDKEKVTKTYIRGVWGVNQDITVLK